MTDEQKELIRIAAQRVLDDAKSGRRYSDEAMAWARHWAATKPLGCALSAGVPDADLPPALRGRNLEVF